MLNKAKHRHMIAKYIIKKHYYSNSILLLNIFTKILLLVDAPCEMCVFNFLSKVYYVWQWQYALPDDPCEMCVFNFLNRIHYVCQW
jgi:hypothetical protein